MTPYTLHRLKALEVRNYRPESVVVEIQRHSMRDRRITPVPLIRCTIAGSEHLSWWERYMTGKIPAPAFYRWRSAGGVHDICAFAQTDISAITPNGVEIEYFWDDDHIPWASSPEDFARELEAKARWRASLI